jgi:hypothetical protein
MDVTSEMTMGMRNNDAIKRGNIFVYFTRGCFAEIGTIAYCCRV